MRASGLMQLRVHVTLIDVTFADYYGGNTPSSKLGTACLRHILFSGPTALFLLLLIHYNIFLLLQIGRLETETHPHSFA